MNCVKAEEHNLSCDVVTGEKTVGKGRIAAFGIVMSLLVPLLVFCLSDLVQSCQTFFAKNRNDIIHIECSPKLLFFEAWDVPTLNVSFKIYDNLLRNRVQRLRWDESFPIDDLTITTDDRLVVIFHGYTENPDETWINDMVSAYFGRPESKSVKAISVDWERAALGQTWLVSRNFVQAASNARVVGRITGNFLGRLMRAYNIEEKSLHVLGHSLGAHAMGETIKVLHEEFQIKAGRATAFDAASPLFEWKGILPDRQHTHFLEALHTSSVTSFFGLFRGEVGVFRAYGHIDLYPNAGSLYQPACRDFNFFFCSHRRGYIYYTDMLLRSVGPCDFEGIQCRNEFEAVSALCSGPRLDVWRQMQSKSNTSRIVYFTTNGDRLKIVCRNRSVFMGTEEYGNGNQLSLSRAQHFFGRLVRRKIGERESLRSFGLVGE